MAFKQHRRRRPQALLDLSRLARLIELASELGRLAGGFDSGLPGKGATNRPQFAIDRGGKGLQ